MVVLMPQEQVRARLGAVVLGDDIETRVMGALNVSPESFYGASVATGDDAILASASRMVEAGASLIDIGAMSTAPYRHTAIAAGEEAARLGRAVRLVTSRLDVPVSADTSRLGPARAALDAGAGVINDVTGLRGEPALASLVAARGAGLILMASDRGGPIDEGAPPAEIVRELLAESLRRAVAAGIDPVQIVIDPGIGFFRRQEMDWHDWDCRILAQLGVLRQLGRPICVGVSRKSFIGAVAGRADPADRLPGSLAAAAAAVLGGAHLIRAHDVDETIQAVQIASAIRRARDRALGSRG
jgi:dihydropteroate synthase